MEVRARTPFLAVGLAMVAGALLAAGRYVGGAILAGLALTLYALWLLGKDRGDDDTGAP